MVTAKRTVGTQPLETTHQDTEDQGCASILLPLKWMHSERSYSEQRGCPQQIVMAPCGVVRVDGKDFPPLFYTTVLNHVLLL